MKTFSLIKKLFVHKLFIGVLFSSFPSLHGALRTPLEEWQSMNYLTDVKTRLWEEVETKRVKKKGRLFILYDASQEEDIEWGISFLAKKEEGEKFSFDIQKEEVRGLHDLEVSRALLLAKDVFLKENVIKKLGQWLGKVMGAIQAGKNMKLAGKLLMDESDESMIHRFSCAEIATLPLLYAWKEYKAYGVALDYARLESNGKPCMTNSE